MRRLLRRILLRLCDWLGIEVVVRDMRSVEATSSASEGRRGAIGRQTPPFTRLRTSLICDVRVLVGEEYDHMVEIEGPERIVSKIRSKVSGNTLTLEHAESFSLVNEPLRVEVRVPNLTYLRSSGTGTVFVTGVKCDTFEAEVSGIGNFNLEGTAHEMRLQTSSTGDTTVSGLCDAGFVTITASGIGDVLVTGTARKLRLRKSGTGTVDLRHLRVYRAAVDSSGIGDLILNVTEKLTGKATGTGDVTVHGRPIMQMARRGIGDLRVR